MCVCVCASGCVCFCLRVFCVRVCRCCVSLPVLICVRAMMCILVYVRVNWVSVLVNTRCKLNANEVSGAADSRKKQFWGRRQRGSFGVSFLGIMFGLIFGCILGG